MFGIKTLDFCKHMPTNVRMFDLNAWNNRKQKKIHSCFWEISIQRQTTNLLA